MKHSEGNVGTHKYLNSKEFAEWRRNYLGERGRHEEFLQQEFAASIGKSPQQVSRSVRGEDSPLSRDIRHKLSVIFGLDDSKIQ